MISIILPTYNRLYSIKEIFLPSLASQNFEAFELIIIDDCSTDGTSEYFTKGDYNKDFPGLKKKTNYYRNVNNLGAPASRNRGSDYANGAWVFVVEDDISLVDYNFLKTAAKILQNAPGDIAVVSPQRYDIVPTGYYKNPRNNFAIVGRLSAEVYLDNSQCYSGFVPTTHASSFIRRNVYTSTLQDEETYTGNTFRDETDLYKKITNNRLKIFYCGDKIKLIHRNDFAKKGGQKKVNGSTLVIQEVKLWGNHYRYIKKYYNYCNLRILAFVLVRFIKIIANHTGVNALKNVLSKWAI